MHYEDIRKHWLSFWCIRTFGVYFWRALREQRTGIKTPKTPGREIWRRRCGQQDTSTDGGRWRRQHSTEQDADECGLWSMYHLLGSLRSQVYSGSMERTNQSIIQLVTDCFASKCLQSWRHFLPLIDWRIDRLHPVSGRLSVKLHLRDGRTDGQSVRLSVS